MVYPSVKQQLFAFCLNYVHQRVSEAEADVRRAQESANEETKSSAGDKYETGRAMAQLEIANHNARLAQARKLLATLNRINPTAPTLRIQAGSLAVTSAGKFYLAIAAGELRIGDATFRIISADSPLGQKLLGLQALDSFTFNGNKVSVKEVT